MFVGPELILFGIVILIAAHLVCKDQEPADRDLMHAILAITGCVMIVTGGLGIVGSLLFAFAVGTIPLGIVTVGIATVVATEAYVKRRDSQRYALLWTMAVAAERSIPLAPAVRAFADERRGLFARRAYRLADVLATGVPLLEALDRVGRLLPPKTLPMIGVGCQSGALGPALRRAAMMRDLRGTARQSLAGKILYLCFVVWFGLGMATFLMWKIVPSFVKIFDDFDLELPESTQLVISVSNFAADWVGLIYPVLSAAILYLLLRYTGLIHWEPPGTNWLVRRLDTAVILDTLSLATEHRQPLPQTLQTLARTYPKAAIRQRLAAATREVAEGNHWCRALQSRRLIKQADLAVLQAAERVGNLPWALGEMAESSRRRLAYRLQAAAQLIYPPLLLLAGAIVMFFVGGLFYPLIVLIRELTCP